LSKFSALAAMPRGFCNRCKASKLFRLGAIILYLRLATHRLPLLARMTKYGALSVVECWRDDVPEGKITSFPMAVQRKDVETVVSSWMVGPSKGPTPWDPLIYLTKRPECIWQRTDIAIEILRRSIPFIFRPSVIHYEEPSSRNRVWRGYL